MGKHKRLIIAVIVLAVITLVMFEVFIGSHMYPQNTIHESSNLSVRGIVTSIEQNHKDDGMVLGSYHIFRFYIHVNITEIVWSEDWLAEWNAISYSNHTVGGWNSIFVGYDNLDDPHLAVGQPIECKGYYVPVTDSPYSFKVTVAPSVNGSYLKPLN